MNKIFMLIMALTLISVWIGFLLPQYAAWKNKRYKTVAICLGSWLVSVVAFVAMVLYGDFITALMYGIEASKTAQANEFVLCILGVIWCVGHWFCWWYIYGRKSLDFIHLKGYTADELDEIISPKFKKLIV